MGIERGLRARPGWWTLPLGVRRRTPRTRASLAEDHEASRPRGAGGVHLPPRAPRRGLIPTTLVVGDAGVSQRSRSELGRYTEVAARCDATAAAAPSFGRRGSSSKDVAPRTLVWECCRSLLL